MKKIFYMYLLLSTFVYGDIVTTNGEISFFYDTELKKINTFRGDIFEDPLISYIDIGVQIGKEIYPLKDYISKVELINNTGIISLESRIGKVTINTYVFPSSKIKSEVYLVNEILNVPLERSVKIFYGIVPYKDSMILDYSSPKDYYSFDGFKMKSLNNSSSLYISQDEYLDLFKFREIRGRERKYQEDRLFFVTDIVESGEQSFDILSIDFSKRDWANRVVRKPEVLKNEYMFWRDWTWDLQEYTQDVTSQLCQLKMLIMGDKSPSKVYYGKSREEFATNLKLATILSIYGKADEGRKLLQNYSFKKKNSKEDVGVLLALIKSWRFSKKNIKKENFMTKVYPIIIRSLDGIDSQGKFDGGEDEIELYYNLIMILEDLLVNFSDFNIQEEKIIEKLDLLKKYTRDKFMVSEGLKDTPKSIGANPRNIKYIDLYPKALRQEILKRDFERYYDRRMGYLIFQRDLPMDLEYNLFFAKALYDNSLEIEGERLFERVRGIVVQNNNYATPQMYPLGNNDPGIYGDMIYLYLLTNYYRGIK